MNHRHTVMAQTGEMARAEGWSRKQLKSHLKRRGAKKADINIALRYFEPPVVKLVYDRWEQIKRDQAEGLRKCIAERREDLTKGGRDNG